MLRLDSSTRTRAFHAANFQSPKKQKGRFCGPFNSNFWNLQSGFNLKAPCFQKRLRDVLRVLIAARPLAQPRRPQVLVRGELILANDLFELSDRRSNGPDRLGLPPIGVSASLGHWRSTFLPSKITATTVFLFSWIPRSVQRIHGSTRNHEPFLPFASCQIALETTDNNKVSSNTSIEK